MEQTPTESKQEKLNTEKPTVTKTSFVNHGTKSFHSYFVLICGAITLLLLGFIGGQNFERARIKHFSGWMNNYERNFFGTPPFPPMKMKGHDLPPDSFRSFTILGTILTVEDKKISVQDDRAKQEQAVIISDSTAIRYNDSNINIGDLKPDQKVAIFGKPDDNGQIVASLIRVLGDNFTDPQSPDSAASSNNQN